MCVAIGVWTQWRRTSIERPAAVDMKGRVATKPARGVFRNETRVPHTEPEALGVGAVADAIGQCILVCAFLPSLVAVAQWLYLEATNPLNVSEPLVLSFVLVRGVTSVLEAFSAGLVAGVVNGLMIGIFVCTWLRARLGGFAPPQLYLVGAVAGGLAACVMIVLVVGVESAAGSERLWGAGAVAFEIVSGMLCGTIAVPTAARLLRAGH